MCICQIYIDKEARVKGPQWRLFVEEATSLDPLRGAIYTTSVDEAPLPISSVNII